MVNYTIIDLTAAEAKCSSYVIGREGESRTEAIKLIVPPKYLNCKTVIEFRLGDGSAYASNALEYAKEIEYTIPSFLRVRGEMIIAITETDDTTGYRKKVFERSFVSVMSAFTESTASAPAEVIEDQSERIAALEKKCAKFAENDDGEMQFNGAEYATKQFVSDLLTTFELDDGILYAETESALVESRDNNTLDVDGYITRTNENGETEVIVCA